jgi:hypothetical protein
LLIESRCFDNLLPVTQSDDSYDLNLAAAELRANGTDVRVLLKTLSNVLADALGSRIVVRQGGGRLRRSKSIEGIEISMDDDKFEANLNGSLLRCTIGHSSGGIQIRSEVVDVDEWVMRLLSALKTEAAHSEVARRVLDNIVTGEIG